MFDDNFVRYDYNDKHTKNLMIRYKDLCKKIRKFIIAMICIGMIPIIVHCLRSYYGGNDYINGIPLFLLYVQFYCSVLLLMKIVYTWYKEKCQERKIIKEILIERIHTIKSTTITDKVILI